MCPSQNIGQSNVDQDDSREPIEMLASEYIDRLRAGEKVSVAEYVARAPELADEIRELFPAMRALENCKATPYDSGTPDDPWSSLEVPERLGDLRIVRQIGRGGMGVVYEAEQESLGRRVAVKVLPRVGIGDERRQQRFKREASAAAKLHHTNIVPVLGVGSASGLHYYVMQLIRGVGLDEIIDRRRDPQGANASFLAHSTKTHLSNSHFADTPRDRTDVNGTNGGMSQTEELAGPAWQADKPADSENKPVEESSSALSGDDQERNEGGENTGEVVNSLETHIGDTTSIWPHGAATTNGEAGASPEINVQRFSPESLDGRHARRSRVMDAIGMSSDPFRAVARVGLQAAEALAYAHEMHTLHRDIKPANLIVDEHGIVWITDFGLAKMLDDETESHTGDLVGTLRYLSPERLSGKCDERSDIHALGLTLYELVAGEPTFAGDDRAQLLQAVGSGNYIPLRRRQKGIPRDLETIIHKAMAPEPHRRYETASDFADDLRRFLEGLPIAARRISPLEKSWRWCQRNPALAAVTSACVALMLMVLVISIRGYVHSQRLLAKEQEQRRVSQETNDLAVRTLDSIYRQFAPRRSSFSTTQGLLEEDGEAVEVTGQPVISDEAARMLESLLPLYTQLAELDGGNDSRFQQKKTDALRRLGDIRRQLGQEALALEAYRSCEEQLAELLVDDPKDVRLMLELVSLRNDIGILERGPGENADWRETHLAALDQLKRIPDEAQDELPWLGERILYETAKAHFQLGREGQPLVVPQWRSTPGRFRGGRGGLEGGRGEPNRDRDQRGSETENRSEAADRDDLEAPSTRGKDDGPGRGNPPDGPPPGRPPGEDGRRSEHSERIASTEGRGDQRGDEDDVDRPGRDGDEDRDRRRRGRGRRGRGPRPGEFSGDPAFLEMAIRESAQLVALQPKEADYQLLLASCYRERSLIQREESDAEADLKRSTDILQQLVTENPDISDYRFELARTLATDLRLDEDGSLLPLEESLNLAVEHARLLTRQHPNVVSYQEFLGLLYLKQGNLLERSGVGFDKVDEIYWAALEIYLRLYERDPEVGIHHLGLQASVGNWFRLAERRMESAEGEEANKDVVGNESGDGESPTAKPSIPSWIQTHRSRLQQIVSTGTNWNQETHFLRMGLLNNAYDQLVSVYRVMGNEEAKQEFETLLETHRRESWERFEQMQREYWEDRRNERGRDGDREADRSGPRQRPPGEPGGPPFPDDFRRERD